VCVCDQYLNWKKIRRGMEKVETNFRSKRITFFIDLWGLQHSLHPIKKK